LFIVASVAWNAYGPLNQPTAGILVQSVNVSPAPTDLVPEHETAPAPAGAVVLTDRSFLGWRQITVNNASGWVRVSVVMPLYRPEKIT
jgi:hypothetical protein